MIKYRQTNWPLQETLVPSISHSHVLLQSLVGLHCLQMLGLFLLQSRHLDTGTPRVGDSCRIWERVAKPQIDHILYQVPVSKKKRSQDAKNNLDLSISRGLNFQIYFCKGWTCETQKSAICRSFSKRQAPFGTWRLSSSSLSRASCNFIRKVCRSSG